MSVVSNNTVTRFMVHILRYHHNGKKRSIFDSPQVLSDPRIQMNVGLNDQNLCSRFSFVVVVVTI